MHLSGRVFWIEVAGGAAALTALAAAGFWWALTGIVRERKEQIVPPLTGKPVAAALDMVSPLNLALRKEGTEFNSSVPVGAILRQTPPAGTKVREGKVIRVVVSQGGETMFVPNLSGLPLRNAEMLLRQGQLLLGEVTESYSLRMEKGMVLSQEPKAESSVERNSIVNVLISGGAPPEGITLVPDFNRKDVSEATAWAGARSVELVVQKDATSLFAYGVVLAQDPAPDTVLPPEGKMEVTISANAKAGASSVRSVRYEVPQGSSDNHVRVVLVDPHGERELFNGLRAPGSKVDLEVPIAKAGGARLKVFLNGILVEERPL